MRMRLSQIRSVLSDPSQSGHFHALSAENIHFLRKLLYRRTGERHLECTCCGCLTPDAEVDNRSEQAICPVCMEDHSRCDSCNVLLPTEEMNIDSDALFCEECYDPPTCDHCGEVTHDPLEEVSMSLHHTEMWCNDCTSEDSSQCYSCGERISQDNTLWVSDEPYCYSCTYQCSACGEHYSSEDDRDECSCSVFLRDYTDRVDQAKGFGDFRRIKIGKKLTSSSRRYVGTELEIEFDCEEGEKESTAKEIAEEIAPLIERSITCRDRSIADGQNERTGFEVKTRPDSIKNTLEELKAVCDFALGHDRSFYGHYTDSRCGFHVHVSRVSLVPSQEVKLYFFMNDHANKSLIKTVMRRHNVYYASTVLLQEKDRLTNFKTSKIGGQLNSMRRECLNFTYKTVEFRGGRSTLKLESLQVTLEFIEALLEFTAPATTSRKDLTSEGFKAWLKTQHGFKVLKKKLS